jgi:hypothetical protein
MAHSPDMFPHLERGHTLQYSPDKALQYSPDKEHMHVGGNDSWTSVLSKEKDFQTEDELRKNFQNSDFFFDLNNATIRGLNNATIRGLNNATIRGPGATLAVSLIVNNKFLGTLPGDGVGHALVTMEPCSIVQPHTHPRGTESSFITKGDHLLSCMQHHLILKLQGFIHQFSAYARLIL